MGNALPFFIAALLAGPQEAGADVRASVVRVLSTRRPPDLYRPWTKAAPEEISGTGVVLEGKRILTNAHVASYAREIYVQPYQSADKLPARVAAIGPGIDLAILALEDEAFFDGAPPLPFAEDLPRVKDAVNVYGYPVGGSELSITEGIVSRTEFDAYYFDASGLRIQVDAALNPGNSGGPAISGDRMIGLVFSRIPEAENIGYLIPIEEIRRFLEDVADGTYEGAARFLHEFQTAENDALRASLGVGAGASGVVVRAARGGGEDLREWDLVTKIGDYEIANDGMVFVRENLRLWFEYLVPQLARDGRVPLTVVRKGETIAVFAAASAEAHRLVPHLLDAYPSYFIYGPLVFTAATQPVVEGLQWSRWRPLLVHRSSPLLARHHDRASFEGEQLVAVASRMFPHRLCKGYGEVSFAVLESVGDVRIRNLRHLVETLRDSKERFVVFRFADRFVENVVFEREKIAEATEEILADNGIRSPCSDDLLDVWKAR